MATLALDAATRAGADFADIRVSETRSYMPTPDYLMASRLYMEYGYGIRVWANGGTAFIGSADPTPEGITRAARSAVASAKDQATLSRARRARPLIARPVARGEWTFPVEIDPFQLSPDDHIVVQNGFKLSGRQAGAVRNSFWSWSSETRVFAASDGSLTTQQATWGRGFVQITKAGWIPGYGLIWGEIDIPGFELKLMGVEAILGEAVHDRLEAAADEIAPLINLPVYRLDDVGRRDLILDGPAFSKLVGQTVVPALRLSRALGEEHDTEGPGFLGDPETVVGQQLFTPALNLQIEAAAPHYGARKWDDEGTETQSVPLVENGIVVRYLGTRGNVGALPLSTHAALGVAFAPRVMTIPTERPGAVSVHTPSNGPSLAELTKQMKDGLLVRGASVQCDPRGGGGVLWSDMMFEVKQGQITRRLFGGRIEFSTKRVLHDPVLGDSGSVGAKDFYIAGGLPFDVSLTVCRAPAALVHGVGLVRN